ncbi:MAG: PaaI family thioesterase [Actinomycetia bacterium]|nr:PaaI family thioesterase [Actinomycetes bacterium]MCP4084758.1 PaaI family thioesterase [Actinomycetes bacterium]
MTDWSSLERAAQAMRRLNQAINRHHGSDDDLAEIAAQAERLAALIEQGDRRDKEADFRTRPHLARIYDGEYAPLEIPDGGEIEFDPFSVIGGAFHPHASGINFFRAGDDVVGRADIDPGHAGPPNRIHGGVVASLVDETMGALNRSHGRRAFTASLTVDYRAAAPIDEPVEFRATTVSHEGRKIVLSCEGSTADGTVFCESKGLFIQPAEDYKP